MQHAGGMLPAAGWTAAAPKRRESGHWPKKKQTPFGVS